MTTSARLARRFAPLLALVLTLRGRLVLLICLSTIPAVLVTFAVSARERTAALERLELEARQVGHLASREHLHQLEGAKNLLLRLQPILARDGTTLRCPPGLDTLLAGYPQFANIGILTPSGTLACSAVPAPGGLAMATNQAFERALRSTGVEVGSYAIGPIVNRPVLHLARAVRSSSGRVLGVAFVALELGWLDELAHQAALPADYALLIADRNGAVLAGTLGGEAPGVPVLADVVHRQHGVVAAVGRPPVPRFFVATPMEGQPDLYVVAGLPYQQVRAETNRTFYRTLMALALVTALTMASALFAAELSVLRVLRTLTRTARRLGAGDLTSRVPLPGSHGELRELASSFNAMADALATREREAVEAQERLRALSHHLQTARDQEAGRIARELHDELGQVLTSLKIDLSHLRRVCAPTPEADCARKLEVARRDLSGRIDDAIDFVRRVASELRPTVLDRLGLAAALEWLVHEFEAKAGLAIFLDVRDVAEPLDNAVAIALFRIVQEALTNVMRHAEATEVRVTLSAAEGRLSLAIRDDGRGVDPARLAARQSLGLLNMQERAHLLGGTWQLHGAPGAGTSIVVSIPLPVAPAPAPGG